MTKGKPLTVPVGVEINTNEREVVVSGPKGKTMRIIPRGVKVTIGPEGVIVEKTGSSKAFHSLQGTIRAHIANMLKGVTEEWEKVLELVGAGYRAEIRGNQLVLILGFSHPVVVDALEGVSFSVDKSLVRVSGVDKEKVGTMAAKIRQIRPPDPYKGKGIRYQGEIVRKKPGKQAAKVEGGV